MQLYNNCTVITVICGFIGVAAAGEHSKRMFLNTL